MTMLGAVNRPVGVQANRQEDIEDAPVDTLTNITRISMYAIEYGDEQGRKVQGLVIDAGGRFYMAAGGAEWLKSLRPLSAKMNEQVAREVKTRTGAETGPRTKEQAASAVPSKDTVPFFGPKVDK